MKFDLYHFFHDDIWLILGCAFLFLKFYFRTFTKFSILSGCAFFMQILIEVSYIESNSFAIQIATFLILSVIGIYFLDPILQKKYVEHANTAQDPIGDTVTVLNGPISKTSYGTITWRGFEKKAILEQTSSEENIEVGQEAIVTQVDGGIFTINPTDENSIYDEN